MRIVTAIRTAVGSTGSMGVPPFRCSGRASVSFYVILRRGGGNSGVWRNFFSGRSPGGGAVTGRLPRTAPLRPSPPGRRRRSDRTIRSWAHLLRSVLPGFRVLLCPTPAGRGKFRSLAELFFGDVPPGPGVLTRLGKLRRAGAEPGVRGGRFSGNASRAPPRRSPPPRRAPAQERSASTRPPPFSPPSGCGVLLCHTPARRGGIQSSCLLFPGLSAGPRWAAAAGPRDGGRRS